MEENRFYHSENLELKHVVELIVQTHIHATKVLRLKVGDQFALFNGDGYDYVAKVIELSKHKTSVEIIDRYEVNHESPLKITLAQGLAAGDKMDWIIQKAVELGIQSIQPLLTERSIVKLDRERADKKLEHWRTVAISACEQTGRSIIPDILSPIHLVQWLSNQNQTANSLKLILTPAKAQNINHLEKPSSPVVFMVGPEGGFSEKEMNLALSSSFVPVNFGKRVLRTETASVVALSIMQNLWGDFA
ncbi:16S rRNA (uracil(1498)-N(3))-methyltransferase [Candidatus Methylopumilus universalis]|jgi:16S rRNA (uracil1498-N3)-methyltransferase|uniref:Ribosomal RNA small subunit methyltransferase E n=1 Tax=Candidatus Methylopumilus universalis TaxID=2588536 RepID=A0ABX5VX51_9PROT|nr:16S rRNA (uracil(1498)-N(3))-methyltransferase [Candidatus Methylopumilus universalis]QDC51477.1 16S rRNA (uracil(1498)-N(3))-methyltransferase [Candidatus Methylopumilus universalis]QDC61614.1 16S rRNA (uracil(1498)-N(3))-methyltransferase [Candidatus Methylopumilus universalis]QDC99372.1 16S rRNA (uracil(1498)-N(3))-methyltransferase [Candidatus Methylopumilus universalis]